MKAGAVACAGLLAMALGLRREALLRAPRAAESWSRSAAEEPAPERAELERLRQRVAELERAREEDRREIERLRRELAEAARERLEREQEWLHFQKALRELRPDGAGAPPPAPAPAPGADEGADAARERDEALARALRSLLAIEEVRGIDLLECGTLREGATGPVVLRVLDERGRPLGTLTAERLRLEGSRAARTLTLVLEDGRERRGGELLPFPESGGRRERRILLPDVDPAHWVEPLRELFGERPPDAPVDDGKHDLVALRLRLNELLREDAAHGSWRVRSLGGVQDRMLRELQVEEQDREGRVLRRLFADRMHVRLLERGVVLELEEGAQLRGDEKTAFLDGRFRIFLPRADHARWKASAIPGLAGGEAQ